VISLAVTCAECGAAAEHEVGAVLVDPDALDDAPERAVYVAMSLTCPSCGAVDAHRVAPEVARALEIDDEVVRAGRAGLSDGTPIHTVSEGIELLRGRAEQNPGDALTWRALGNFAMRSGRAAAALEAWGRGAEVDGELECALNVAVDAVEREAPDAADRVARALERLVHAQNERRPLQAAYVAELVRKVGAPMTVVVDGDPKDASTIRDWSRFGEALAIATRIEVKR